MKVSYEIKLKDCAAVCGSVDWEGGRLTIAPALPAGVVEYARATVRVPLGEDEKIFMNGYQTWTYCPEYTRAGYTKDIGPIPEAAIRHYGLRSYGDYFFVDYPQQPGTTHGESWCYFREGERFRLFASLDEEPGYTLFRFVSHEDSLTIERDCAGLAVSGEFHAFDLFYAAGGEDEVFDAWFAEMGVKPRTAQRLAGYSSWYNRYEDISAASIRSDLLGCTEQLQPGDLFQIDDGWEGAVGDWLEPDFLKFPDGMKAAADEIHAKGFRAGLWLAPFVAEKESFLFRQHPDWFLQVDGKPWYAGINWSGFYALDIDNPEVVTYLTRVFRRVFDEWGYDLVKLDFLYAAAPVGSEKESRAGRMLRAMKLLRKLCGDKLILGCGVPLMPAFGLVDYCRISCDVGLDWDDTPLMQLTHRERVSTRQAIGNTIFRRELNGRAWLNDPDVFFLRSENLKLTRREQEILWTVNGLFSGILLHSDDMANWSEEARALYPRIRRLAEAQDVRVHADHGLSVSYILDGERHSVVVE